jgi:hypothetical protein
MASLRSWLATWSLTYRGAKHLARIGASELLRRQLIDEETAARADAHRDEYVDALLKP